MADGQLRAQGGACRFGCFDHKQMLGGNGRQNKDWEGFSKNNVTVTAPFMARLQFVIRQVSDFGSLSEPQRRVAWRPHPPGPRVQGSALPNQRGPVCSLCLAPKPPSPIGPHEPVGD